MNLSRGCINAALQAIELRSDVHAENDRIALGDLLLELTAIAGIHALVIVNPKAGGLGGNRSIGLPRAICGIIGKIRPTGRALLLHQLERIADAAATGARIKLDLVVDV